MSIRIASWGGAALLAATVLSPVQAAPFMANGAIKAASQDEVTQVRWRGYGWGGAAVAAGIAGLALGAAAASQPYYGPPPAYYGPPPAYYGPPAYPYAYSYPAPYYQGYRDHNSGGNW